VKLRNPFFWDVTLFGCYQHKLGGLGWYETEPRNITEERRAAPNDKPNYRSEHLVFVHSDSERRDKFSDLILASILQILSADTSFAYAIDICDFPRYFSFATFSNDC
jgi:hypothetical protein